MPWDSSEEQMGAPREMRIHVQRVIAIPAPHNMPPPPENMSPFQPPPPPQQNPEQNEVKLWCFIFVLFLYNMQVQTMSTCSTGTFHPGYLSFNIYKNESNKLF